MLTESHFLIFFFVALFCFGAIFGSFSTVLIARWRSGEKWILTWRSHCPNCQHILTWKELFPIFSWLIQWWKCKNCKKPIPKRYPIIETIMGISFMLWGYIFIKLWWENFFFLASILFLIFITIVYIIYDFFYMEIPEEIYIIYIVYFFILFILSYFFEFKNIYFLSNTSYTFHTFIIDKIFAAIILYSFLFLQIFIPGTIFLLQKKRSKEIFELIFLYFFFPILVIYDFVKYKICNSPHSNDETESDIPTWIGAWDLFLAIIIGTTLGLTHGIVAFFFAYITGSIVGVFLLFLQNFSQKKKNLKTEIAFGPFLGLGFLFSLTYYSEISYFIQQYWNL